MISALTLIALSFFALSSATPICRRTTCVNTQSSVVREGIQYLTYDDCATGSRMEYVKNSGICETTPGVNQYSGYISNTPNTKNANTFFWFFEARQNPSTAPLAIWINGGPGCSSMIGLFQENGPCQFYNNASTPSMNPHSWNNYANMLYIDQPVGTGFSLNSTNLVSSTNGTSAPLWNVIQAFYARFPQYKSRDLGVFSESYGGHYLPALVRYIQAQNAAIDSKAITGTKINLAAMGINDGWYDMKTHLNSYLDYGVNNKYRSVISPALVAQLNATMINTCGPALDKCAKTGLNSDCHDADHYCNDNVYGKITDAVDFDVYDVRADPSLAPPSTYIDYLQRPDIMKAIGARQQYTECADNVYEPFDTTGDEARSSVYDLTKVVASGVNTVIWHGDADFDCNYIAGLSIANSLQWSGQAAFKSKPLAMYKVESNAAGFFKTQGNLSFLQVNGAGHEIPFYQPKLALQVFKQAMSRKPLSSTP